MLPTVFSQRNSPKFFDSINIRDNPLKSYKSLSPIPYSYAKKRNPKKGKINMTTKVSKLIAINEPSNTNEADEFKLKGLEEIGIFSEFTHSKKIFDHDEPENMKKQSTIHITDFMRKDQKMKLCKIAGGLKAYILKKSQYKKNLMHRESTFRKFFYIREKLPLNFATPQNSPRVGKDSERIEVVFNNSHSQNVLAINKIIERCDEAIHMSTSYKGMGSKFK